MKTQLQAMRKRAGFKSAKAFAEHIGESPRTYTEYEQGRINLSLEKAWEFADALECTLDEIAGRKPPKRAYADPMQALVNTCYENMNESGRMLLSETAKSMCADPARRIVKDGTAGLYAEPGMGA